MSWFKKDEMPERCPFCSIASGEVSSPVIYQDENVIATLDIRPANRGHILVFPKKHYNVISQMPQKQFLHLFAVVRVLTVALLHTIAPKGVNLVTRSGRAAGQTVQHASVHIVPREKDDRVRIGWEGQEVDEESLMKVRKEIRSYLEQEEASIKKEGQGQTEKRRKPMKRAKRTQKPKGLEKKRRGKTKKEQEEKGKAEEEEDLEEFRMPLP